MLNYNSHYKIYANQSLDWLPMDTKALYEKNLKENYQLLEQHNWIDKSFTYKFNSHGFRCEEFTTNPTMMFLGCSFTCGIGLPIETVWTELVSKQLNMKCANLGQGGGSSDTAFRLCHGWIDKINPQIVFLLTPPGIRIEMVSEKYSSNINVNIVDSPYKRFLSDWMTDDNNHYFNITKNKLAIENLCKSKNIKFIGIDSNELKKIDLARDLSHRGVESNSKFAKYALSHV